MFGTVVAKIFITPTSEHHAVMTEQAGFTNFAGLSPAGRSVGGDLLDLPRAPDRHGDGYDDRSDAAGRCDVRALDEDRARIGIVGEPPPKEGWRVVDWPAEDVEPGVSQLGLECQTPGDPLCRPPEEGEHNGADGEDLAPEDLGRVHDDGGSGDHRAHLASSNQCQEGARILKRRNWMVRMPSIGPLRPLTEPLPVGVRRFISDSGKGRSWAAGLAAPAALRSKTDLVSVRCRQLERG